MNDKDKADLELKIAKEEYGEPDFAPWWMILLFVLFAIIVIASIVFGIDTSEALE